MSLAAAERPSELHGSFSGRFGPSGRPASQSAVRLARPSGAGQLHVARRALRWNQLVWRARFVTNDNRRWPIQMGPIH